MLLILEGIIMCFILLLVCVIGIPNGPVGMVTLYEADVQQRVVELGLTTTKKIKKATILSGILLAVIAGGYALYLALAVNEENTQLTN